MSSQSSTPIRMGAVNFTGNWLMDSTASDSLDPLLTYHGFNLTPITAAASASSASTASSSSGDTAAAGIGGYNASLIHTQNGTSVLHNIPPSLMQGSTPLSSSVTDSFTQLHSVTEHGEVESPSSNTPSRRVSATSNGSAEARVEQVSPDSAVAAVQSVPALIVQHSTRRLTTYLHNLIPRYNAAGTLMRYDPVQTNSKLSVHEEYKLDGEYHWIQTARGKVQARAYIAPHGQSLIVDTRCASKYDLERTERYMEHDGKSMVIEIRILSCAPEAVADEAAPSTLGVSKHFLDQKPTPDSKKKGQIQGAAAAAGQVVVKEILFLKRVFKRIVDADPKAAAAAAAANSTSNSQVHTPQSAVHLPAFGSGVTSADAASDSRKHESKSSDESDTKLGGRLNFDSAEANHQSPVKVRNGAAVEVKTMKLNTNTAAILPASLISSYHASSSSPSPSLPSSSLFQSLHDHILYPRHYLLRRYGLTQLMSNDAAIKSNPSMQSTLIEEQAAYVAARRRMMIIDLILVVSVLLFLCVQFGLLQQGGPSSSSLPSAAAIVPSTLSPPLGKSDL